jgi:hypothetical protein
VIDFLYGSAWLALAGALSGLGYIAFEGSINGPRRRDYIAGKATR